MAFKEQYERTKSKLIGDSTICDENLALFREFFEYQEYKLKRINNLSSLDEACYKTLSGYVTRLRNVNTWFGNKPWKELTKADIKRVYDDLEDGRIKKRDGTRFEDRASYYNKIFKSKPFKIAGKSELAREVMEFSTIPSDKEVRFVTEESFRKMVSVLSKPKHLFLFWLAWDVGENIGALLQLTKRDFVRQMNPYTEEVEYLVNLPRDKIKRSRQSRSEPTLYPETVRFADMVLERLGDGDRPFGFGHRYALKLIKTSAEKTGAKCMPYNDSISWKDLRSGMACHLLKLGFTRDEINARLGHKPSSKVLDKYINYLAIDRHKPKSKLQMTSLEELQRDLKESRQREKLAGERLRRLEEQNSLLGFKMESLKSDIRSVRDELRRSRLKALAFVEGRQRV